MENSIQPEPKKSNTGLIIGIGVAVVLLLCCCAVIIIAALSVMGSAVGTTFSSINNELMLTAMPDDILPISPDDMPAFPTISPDMTMPAFPTISPDMTMPSAADLIPTGGKGNDTERALAWSYVIIEAAMDGCSMSDPKASDFGITVKEEPNSDGVWTEEWTTACDGGSKKSYTVTFTPDSSGNTEVKVK